MNYLRHIILEMSENTLKECALFKNIVLKHLNLIKTIF